MTGVQTCALPIFSTSRARLAMLADSAKRLGIYSLLERRRESLSYIKDKLCTLMASSIEAKRAKYLATVDKLAALNPLSVLSRGYSVAQIGERVISQVSDVSVGDTVRVRLSDGAFDAEITNVLGD